nr:hypothetical protein [Actinacidiphila yeochonensis]
MRTNWSRSTGGRESSGPGARSPARWSAAKRRHASGATAPDVSTTPRRAHTSAITSPRATSGATRPACRACWSSWPMMSRNCSTWDALVGPSTLSA